MYIAKNKNLWLVALAAGLIGLSSCNKEDMTSPTEPSKNSEYVIVEGTGERVSLEFSGEANLEAFNIQPEQARYLIKGDGTQPRTAPIINLDSHTGKGNAKTLLIRLVDKNEPTKITERIVKADELLIEGSEGKYTFGFTIDVALQEGQSFENGEWYISGIYGGTEANPTQFEFTPRFVSNTEGAAGVDLTTSLVIPWTRVFTRNSPSSDDSNTNIKTGVGRTAMSQLSPKLGRNFSLTLKPDGVLFRVRPVSRLVNNILYSNIRLKTDDITIGTHDYSKPQSINVTDLENGAHPAVTSTTKNYNNTNSLEQVSILNTVSKQGYILPSGDFGRAEILVWGFPVEGQATDNSKKTEVWVHSSGRSGYFTRQDFVWGPQTLIKDDGSDNGLIQKHLVQDIIYAHPSTENRGNNGVQDNTIAKHWRTQPFYQTVKKQAYKRGVAYLILPVVDSELIITERYSAIQDPSEANRIGLIEIYNPTLRSIDLSQYGLARVAATGMEQVTTTNDVFLPSGGGQLVAAYSYGKLFAFPHMGEALVSGYGFWDTDYVFAQGSKYLDAKSNTPTGQLFRHAVVLPFSQSNSSRTTGIGLQGTRSLGSADITATAYNIPSITYYASEVKSEYTTLYRDYSSELGTTAYNASGSNILEPGQTMIILTNAFLDGPGSSIPFEQDIRKAAQQGYCKYVVAMNNAKTKTAEPMNAEAGVMTLGSYDIPLLLKKRNGSAGEYYHLVDGLWTAGNNGSGIGGYLGNKADDTNRGLFNRFVEAKLGNKGGLWEKRSVGGAIFNYPIGFMGSQVEAKPYTIGTDNFANFGVLLFEQQTTPRDASKYTIKWTKK